MRCSGVDWGGRSNRRCRASASSEGPAMRLSMRLTLAMVGLVGAHRRRRRRAHSSQIEHARCRGRSAARHPRQPADAAARGRRSRRAQSLRAGPVDRRPRAGGDGGDFDPATGTPVDAFEAADHGAVRGRAHRQARVFGDRIIGVADGGRELVPVDRRGPGGAIRACPTRSCSARATRPTSGPRSSPAQQTYARRQLQPRPRSGREALPADAAGRPPIVGPDGGASGS